MLYTGCAATCYALYRAYRSMKAGDSVEMNKMFRARIYAQAFTLLAIVAGGVYFKTERQQRREFEKALEVRKAQEKRDAWLRELEVRDKEDREWRERHAAIEAAAKEAGKTTASASAANATTTKKTSAVKTPASSSPASSSGAATPAESPSEQDIARAAVEPADQKKTGGILDAVRALVSGKKGD